MSLQICSLSKSFSARTLFEDVTFSLNQGECIALTGSNGSGKTTLMKILLGQEQPDSGNVTSPKDAKFGHLPQQIFARKASFEGQETDLSLLELVNQAFTDLEEIESKISSLEKDISQGKLNLQDELDRLLIEYREKGGYSRQAKISRVLKGFGFNESEFENPLSSFSGGWQMRAFFARLLLREPDYLLLDEPTNYLDISSIKFLEDYLSDYQGGILVISHDRYFLDKLATSVVAIMPEGAKLFRGNYSEYLQAREQWTQEAKAAAERQERQIKKVERFVERFRYKASKASGVQSRIKQLAKIEKVKQYRSVPKISFSFPKCAPSGEVVLTAESISRSYDLKKVLDDISFTICRGNRVAITGENGAGKTTLMRILAGDDLQFEGSLNYGYKVNHAYFAQDEEISFKGDETVYERMLRDTPIDEAGNLRNLLGAFLFSGDDVEKKVRVLSGGEKSRLGLARMMTEPCNLLLLDEPTNHLDINSRDALLNALENFQGTIILVSHDRYFLDCIADRILYLKDNKAYMCEGNYSNFLDRYSSLINSEKNIESSQHIDDDPKKHAREAYRLQKQLNNRIQKLNKCINESEEKIENYEKMIADTEETLATPDTGTDTNKINQVVQNYQMLKKKLEEEMKHWEEFQSELAQKQSQLENLQSRKADGESYVAK